MSDQSAHEIRAWARTIDRWASAGELCFVVTLEDVRPATRADVAEALANVRRRRTESDG